ncbi:MAG TPA: hypothetical protein VE983_10725 [Solirubrobacteraceae bacterium]|nr:hypothetical protein [Solirubrobacteraceae bacterium]
MNDDWRLRIHLHDPGRGHQLTQVMEAATLEQELERALPDRVVVSHDQDDVFCYVETREQAERARDLVAGLAAKNDWRLDTSVARWHPVAEEWEDPDKPLPTSGTEVSAEHAEVVEREREEAREQGYPDFEVRVHCRSRSAAIELAQRLEAEGIPSVRRWHYLVVGAADEDTATALARRIGEESPPGSVVTTEGSGQAANAVRPGNPFAIFGGLGG